MSENTPSSAPAEANAAPESAEIESQEQGNDAPEGQQAQTAPLSAKEEKKIKDEIKKWKLKVDGQELEMDEGELVRNAQLGKAAYKRMEEAANLRKDVDQLLHLLKTNPRKILSDPALGVDIKKFAEEIINEEIEEMKKSPEQREKEKLQRELEEERAKNKAAEERAKMAELARLEEQEATKIENDMMEALKESGLPQKPYFVKRIADYMYLALQNGKDVDVKDVIPLVRKEISGDLREMMSVSSDELLEELIGKESISRFRKKAVAKLKTPAAPSSKDIKPTGETVKKEEAAPKKITMKDFLKM